jgi:signal transduction histidine kinase
MLARIGEKNARLSRATAQARERKHRSLSLVEQIEKERARIARELHAGAGQPLAGLQISLELLDSWCAAMPDSMPDEVRQAVLRMHHLTEAALGQVRAVSHRLHPPDWQDLPISAALQVLVRDSGIGEKCQVLLQLNALSEEPPHAVRLALYRCAQECIANAIRHSGASEFSLAVTAAHGRVELTFRDNGRGIPEGAAKGGGIGLISIEEHAAAAGGISRIISNQGGTTIQVSLPLAEE